MSQYDFGNLSSPLSGTTFFDSNLEPWRDALHSSHSGDSRPEYVETGMMWIDNSASPWVLKVFQGSDDIVMGDLDPSTLVFTPSNQSNDFPDGITASDLELDTPLAVEYGGTGANSLTGILKGGGTSAFSAATAGTDYVSPTGTETLTNKTLTRPTLSGSMNESVVTANTGTEYTINLNNGPNFNLTLTGNCTFTFSNSPADSGAFNLYLTQDGTGSRTVTWPESVLWPGGSPPSLTGTANSVDVFTFVTFDGGTSWNGFLAGANMS